MICLECRAEVGFVLHRYPESLLLTHKSLANLFELACFYIIIIHWLVHLLIRLYSFRSYLFVHHIFNIQLQFIPFLFIYPSATLFIVSTTIVWSSSNLYFFPPPPSSPHPRLHPPISSLFFYWRRMLLCWPLWPSALRLNEREQQENRVGDVG